MNERTSKEIEKKFKEENPMRLSPYDRCKPYKKGKRGIITSN